MRIRDEHGQLDFERIELARMMLATAVRARAEGTNVRKALDARAASFGFFGVTSLLQGIEHSSSSATSNRVAIDASATSCETLDLQAAFARYFALESGQYVSDSRQRRDERGMARDIMELWSPASKLVAIRTRAFKDLWRWMASQHFSGRTREVIVGRQTQTDKYGNTSRRRRVRVMRWGGLRHVERSIRLVAKLLRYCSENDLLQDVPQLPDKWKEKLWKDWEQYAVRAGERLTKPDPVSREYTTVDSTRLYSKASELPQRLHLMLEIAPLWRFGQALRLQRLDFRLDIGSYGALNCEGRGAKWGAWMWLTEWQRLVMDWALGSFLSPWEERFQDGLILNYPIFPAGRLNSRKPSLSMVHLTEPGLRLQFNEAERIAGIKHVAGRGWYGLKRRAQNILEDLGRGDNRIAGLLSGSEQDSEETGGDALRNALSGHSARSTREMYQRHDRPEIWQRAIVVMTELRRQLGGEPDPARDLV
ncbi:MAG: hypothetical protein ACYC7F_11710 [Gemmatimonadaceae bacterium]